MFDYSDAIWAHFDAPRHVGELFPGANIGIGSAGSVDEKSLLRLSIAIRDDQISTARFRAYGCGVTIACGSWLCEQLPGRSLAEAAALDNVAIAAALALPPLKIRCAVVAEQALRAAVEDYLFQRRNI